MGRKKQYFRRFVSFLVTFVMLMGMVSLNTLHVKAAETVTQVYLVNGLTGTTDIEVNGVTWDSNENAAYFKGGPKNGDPSFISINGVLPYINSETGFEISFEAKVASGCANYARFFSVNDDVNGDTTKEDFELFARGGGYHGNKPIVIEYRSQSYGGGANTYFTPGTSLESEILQWNTYRIVSKDGNTSVYMNDTLIASKAGDAKATHVLGLINGWANFWLGKSAFGDDYFKGWMRNVRITTAPSSHSHDSIVFTPWSSASAFPTSAGNYYLTADMNVSGAWTIPSGTTSICLNGHKVTTGQHIEIPAGSSLVIYDDTANGSITSVKHTGSMFWVKGSLVLNSGTIVGNVGSAGIIDITQNASFTMNGGKLTGTASDRIDAAVIRFTGSNGSFNMNGGEISGSTSDSRGVISFGDNNTSYAGGVTINISGTAKITGNYTKGSVLKNIELVGSQKINITGQLDETAVIGIGMQTPGVFTSGADGKAIAANFTSDNLNYSILASGNELKLDTGYTVTFDTDGGSAVADQTVASGNKVTKPEDPTKDNYKFGGWYSDSALTEVFDFENTTINNDTTIYAKWLQSISYTVTFKVVNGSWNDGTTADRIVNLNGYEGDTLKLTVDQIPAAGSYPDDTFMAGSWNTVPTADVVITADTTYTYTYAAKGQAVVSTSPSANDITYDGSAHALVSGGSSTGGSMQYAFGNDASTAPSDGWSSSVPSATDTGIYYVWYMASGDDTHVDSAPACVSVTIQAEDKSTLPNVVGDAEDLYDNIKNDTNYDNISDDLNNAINDAQAILNNDNVTADEIADAISNLENAIKSAKEAKEGVDERIAAELKVWLDPLRTEIAIGIENVIATGEEATVTYEGDFSIPYEIMEKLQSNPQVTLVYTFTYEGETYTVTIPGRSVIADPEIPWYGPAYLLAHYGSGTEAAAEAEEPVVPVVEFMEYIVKPGDTLNDISAQYGTPVDIMVLLNGIKNPNLIFPGQKIVMFKPADQTVS